jgi:hypothetical protein
MWNITEKPWIRVSLLQLAAACAALALTVGCDDDNDDEGSGATTTSLAGATTTSLGPTTTIHGDTTTTVIIDEPGSECAVTWRLTNDVTLGALQIETDYASAPGDFSGSADQVVCVDLTGSLASFNDRDDERTLNAGLISLGGIDGPTDVMRCNFTHDGDSSESAEPADFIVTVIDAADPDLAPATADVEVSEVTCIPTGTTTPTVSTSTTTVTTTTSTTFAGPLTGIGFTLVGTTARVGALQLAIDYSSAPGSFDGSGAEAACTPRVAGLSSFNDIEAERTLNAGLIVPAGFTSPRLVMDCAFTASGGTPAPEDFDVTIVDITDVSLNPVTGASIVVTVP